MAYFKNHWKAQEGKGISATGLAEIARTCDWITKLRVAPPLALSNITGGPLITANLVVEYPFLAVTNGSVSASSVVTAGVKWTPGSGTVYAVEYVEADSALEADTSTTYDVRNFSTTTGGIASGVLVWVAWDGTMSAGTPNYYIVTVDCAN